MQLSPYPQNRRRILNKTVKVRQKKMKLRSYFFKIPSAVSSLLGECDLLRSTLH